MVIKRAALYCIRMCVLEPGEALFLFCYCVRVFFTRFQSSIGESVYDFFFSRAVAFRIQIFSMLNHLSYQSKIVTGQWECARCGTVFFSLSVSLSSFIEQRKKILCMSTREM